MTTDNASLTPRRATWLDPRLLLLVAVTLAWVIYRPDRARPFDVLDFGEFVPILKASNSWWEQFTVMVRYGMEQHGRPYFVTCLTTVLKWQLFGSSMVGWQMVHAVLMMTMVVQTYQLLRRLGSSEIGSALGASIWLFAPAASYGWIRLTLAEPTAMVVLLGLCLRATTYQRRENWKADLFWFAVGSAFIILVKEMMAPTLLLPLLVALFVRADGAIAWTGVTRRNVVLAAVVSLVSLATLIPLAIIYVSASSNALASQYGTRSASLGDVFARWLFTLVPFDPINAAPSVVWVMAVLGLVGLVVLGWREAIARRFSGAGVLLVTALLFPLLGVASYAPWPQWEMRYVFPYLIGVSLLVGIAGTMLGGASKRGQLLVALIWLPAVVLGGSEAYSRSARNESVSRTFEQVVDVISTMPGTDSVFIASNVNWVPEWTGLGPTLQRFAGATDRAWLPTRQIRCEEIGKVQASRPRIAVVTFANHCNTTLNATHNLATSFAAIDWQNWSIAWGSVHAKVFVSQAK